LLSLRLTFTLRSSFHLLKAYVRQAAHATAPRALNAGCIESGIYNALTWRTKYLLFLNIDYLSRINLGLCGSGSKDTEIRPPPP
jgi:hypothetical protein